jgi:general secretion pathway protein A
MYCTFFGLSRTAFEMTSDPAFLFLAPQHREALAGLTHGIIARTGFLLLSGPAGAGKTTLLTWLVDKLSAIKVRTSVIVNPMLSPGDFLEMALLDLGMVRIPATKAGRLLALQGFLMEAHRHGSTAALIVDEAHKLSYELMEEIRLLGNYEHPGGKLLQIVLAGQSEIDDVLSDPALWQFKQRIGMRAEIRPLDRATVECYIRHRWRVAGGADSPPFSAETLDRIALWSQGIPRLVNSLCGNALVLAYAGNDRHVLPRHVDEAAADLRLPVNGILMSAPAARPQPKDSRPNSAAWPEPPPLRAAEPSAKDSLRSRWAMRLGLA